MKTVNLDDVLRILHKYGTFIFVTDDKKYSDMVDEIANVEALEQQPCEDCISRVDALSEISSYFMAEEDKNGTTYQIAHEDGINTAYEAVEKLPPVQPKPKTGHWIPISERLPKTSGVYRVTRYYLDKMSPHYLVDACYFDGSNTWYNDNRINHERAYADNVIAWQENPEPYKAEK